MFRVRVAEGLAAPRRVTFSTWPQPVYALQHLAVSALPSALPTTSNDLCSPRDAMATASVYRSPGFDFSHEIR